MLHITHSGSFYESLKAPEEALACLGWSVKRNQEAVKGRGAPELRQEGRKGASERAILGRRATCVCVGREGLTFEGLRCSVCWGHQGQQKAPQEIKLEK